MSDIQTSLSIHDRLTGPLIKIMTAMESTIKVMEQMDSATAKMDTGSLANARKNIESASVELNHLQTSLSQAGKEAEEAADRQKKFNDTLGGGLSKVKSYATALLSAVGAYKAFNAAKGFFSDIFSRGVEFNTFRQSSEVAFATFLGDAEKAKRYMDDMYAFALKTPFAYPDLLESSRNLIAFGIQAEHTFPIMKAIGDAVAATGGSNADMQNLADIFGVIQAQGRITAMEVNRLSNYGINTYELLGQAAGVSAEEMKKRISAGAVGAGQAIGALVEGIDKQYGGLMEGIKGTYVGAIDSMNAAKRNAGAKMMEAFTVDNGPLVNLVNAITNNIKKIPTYIGPAVTAFVPLMNMFNETFGNNRFDSVFSSIGASVTFVANIFSWIGMLVLWIVGLVADFWSWIEPIAIALGAVLTVVAGILIVLGLIKTATLAWAGVMWIVSAAHLSNPIVWVLLTIVAVIALVIYAMVNWADQAAIVFGSIVGGIYWLFAVFYNVMAFIVNIAIAVAEGFANAWLLGIYSVQMGWIAFNLLVRTIFDAIGNAVLRTAEWFANTWNDAVYGVQMAFYKMQEGILTIMSSLASGIVGAVNNALSAVSTLVNGAISGINSLIGLINNIPGVDIGEIDNVDLKVSTAAVDKLNSIKASLEKPTKVEPVNLGSFNTAGNYMKNVQIPESPQMVSFDRKGYMNLGESFNKGYETGANLSYRASDALTKGLNKVTGLFGDENPLTPPIGDPPDMTMSDLMEALDPTGGKGNTNPTGGKLDRIGKIDDDINIADEDLKMLKELADIRSIQNFITLQPHVEFGDVTVQEESDIDLIVEKTIRAIDTKFDDDMNRSTKGAYS